ncbi:MAG: glycosyltransferase family 2 protein, partial [Verrucomicrobiae bacterium]|nr:glycosyltransferase family 2 protein [Verrucomicrobiae bacterium]
MNTRRFLPERMESILAQTLTDWELIICDSYSDDGSWEFFQKFADDPRVRLYQVPRAGLYAGWNECLRRVRGRYVYIATSDDTCEPQLLERLVGVLEQHPDVAMASCNFRFIDEAGKSVAGEQPNGAAIYGDWLQRDH